MKADAIKDNHVYAVRTDGCVKGIFTNLDDALESANTEKYMGHKDILKVELNRDDGIYKSKPVPLDYCLG